MIAIAPFTMEQIKSCADAIRAKLPVVKIILFGSSARGDTTQDSDADLLVVLKDNHGLKRPRYEATLAVAKARTGVPTDILVITEKASRSPHSPIIEDALKEGILV